MKLSTLVSRAVFGCLLVVTPALADAPTDQYEPFDRGTALIKDVWTRLEWERRPPTTSTTASIASARCQSLPGVPMRLPTVKELMTIVDEEPHSEYEFGAVVSKMIDAAAFPATPVDLPYWTSTPASGGKTWAIDFRDGTMTSRAVSDVARSRCVR